MNYPQRHERHSQPERIKKMQQGSPKGFVSVPTLEQLKPTPREAELLKILWDWQEQSAKSHVVLGQPLNDIDQCVAFIENPNEIEEAMIRHNRQIGEILTRARSRLAEHGADLALEQAHRKQAQAIRQALDQLHKGNLDDAKRILEGAI